ncbi:hypothetical protein LOZ57_000495 [Ophidiomyces ophidiicola]|uniref:uncharacterized protein n=1 Tax=Ophidiomyces ophidiicola TaxID=1387563 RepID=UPI0020C29863|nr:uncharacterized protein LOZ57_000495 [Ophidiomyces ophidiicola]KAI1954145.1 hypothetical protein LOZ57_000495 [Ophidiomyces ophidiicola]KAI2052409.1 hypothetical protein LOZ43_004530 [Ophidiomyces ophidiicola]
MAYSQRGPPSRPPPVRQYPSQQAPPGNGWQGNMGRGQNNYREDPGYGGFDDYQYNRQERYPVQQRGPHYQQRPPRGPPPEHTGYGYNDYDYQEPRRPPPPQAHRNVSSNRPPPLRNPSNAAIEPAPTSATLSSRQWDGPFPTFPSKKPRGNSFDLDLGAELGGLSINDKPGPARPHTSNSHRQRPVQIPTEPLPSLMTSRPGGWPLAGSSDRDPYSAPPRESTPHVSAPKRSATMPMNAPNPPRYPGQPTWQEASSDRGGSAVPPRPATTTGVRPDAVAPPNVPPVPKEHQATTSYYEDDYYDDDDVLDHYLNSTEHDSDLPNFSAMDNSRGHHEESLIPLDKSKAPNATQSESKPTYTAYQPSSGTAQPYRSQASPDQSQNSGYQYNRPGMAPRYPSNGDGYGYPTADPYSRPPDTRGMTPRPGSARPHYSPGPPNQYQQYPAPNNIGRRPSLDYQGSYSGIQDPNVNGQGQYQNPDALPHHPVPFRPGLEQGSKPPPVRQYDNQSNFASQPRPGSIEQPSRPASGPITPQELQQIQQAARSNPSDQATQLLLAKKLVEASVHLIDDGRGDARTRNKNRERYIFDAHKIIKKLVNGGYPHAMFYLADCYGQGLLGLQVDPKEAFNLYQSAAKLGHAESAYRLAVCCEMGHEGGGGTRRDPMKAVQWYRRAAALGDTPAMYKMGMILLKALLGQARNPREALSWLKRAAERADEDNPHALHELALLYENPSGNDAVIRDENYARELLLQAAELGYKFSQHRLGAAFEYGLLGCPVDPRQSIFWYTRAAAQGEHQSELSLSGWYLTGAEGILQQNDTEAYLWARKAAISGLAKAEYAMGYFTEVGIGVPANLDDAKRWYWKASSQNFLKARERLEDLKRGGAKMQKTRVSRSAVNKQNEGDCVVM